MIETLFCQVNRTVVAVLPVLDLHNEKPLGIPLNATHYFTLACN
ncbi:MAG TPA: hypothetical protein VGH95_00925 [Candidatus Aquirickettsiella sp.]